MKIKWFLNSLYLVIIMILMLSCEKTIVTNSDSSENEDQADYLWDTSTVVEIILNSASISVEPPVATVTGSKVTITSAGTYNISGALTDGQIIVKTEDEGNVRLILNGVNINCSSSAPMYVSKAKKAIIILADGTDNYLSDGTSYTLVNGEPGAAVFSNSYLSLSGDGSLTVTGNFHDGISSDDGLLINGGKISVTSADDGIRGKDYLIVRKGTITVKSKGDGLKSDNSENESMGFISIDSGEFNITASAGDAVNARTRLTITDGTFNITTGSGAVISTGTANQGGGPGGGSGGYSGTLSEKALKASESLLIEKGNFIINSADDALHSNTGIVVNDGNFTIASGDDALHADGSIVINGGILNISKCYEGMESPSITLNKGDITLVSVDDSFNATRGAATETNDGSCLYINGGNIMVNTTGGDGIDSNGNVVMTGGTVIAHGPPSAPEVGIDVNGSFNVSGGLLVASGPNSGNMIEAISTTSAQYCIKATIASALSSTTLFHIEDASGKCLVTYKPVRNLYYIVFSSPDLVNGASYSIYTGGTSTGTFGNGLFTGGAYSGGTFRKAFTVSSKVSNISF
jgi:hypothetical protein